MTRQMESHEVLDMVMGRDQSFHMTRADEKRLRALNERIQAEDPHAVPDGETWNDTLRILVSAMLERGLDESERDVGLAALNHGELVPRPKSRWKFRLRDAWRALRGL
jgi:hypothetical protein